MRRILLAVVFSVTAGAGFVGAQTAPQTSATRVHRLLDCPASQIPDANKGFAIWDKDHAGVNPVDPGLRTAPDPIAHLRRVLSGIDPSLQREHDRTMMLFNLEGFTPENTPLGDVAINPPQSFAEQIPKLKLTLKVVPCGKTLVYRPSEAAPDRVGPDGSRYAQAKTWNNDQPAVLGFYEEGVYTPDTGEPGVRVIETEDIVLTEGVNKDNKMFGRFYIVCGNLDFFLTELRESLTPSVTVTGTLPPPPEKPKATLVLTKTCQQDGKDDPACVGMPTPVFVIKRKGSDTEILAGSLEWDEESGALVSSTTFDPGSISFLEKPIPGWKAKYQGSQEFEAKADQVVHRLIINISEQLSEPPPAAVVAPPSSHGRKPCTGGWKYVCIAAPLAVVPFFIHPGPLTNPTPGKGTGTSPTSPGTR